jgi:hypothetical protein
MEIREMTGATIIYIRANQVTRQDRNDVWIKLNISK